VKELEIPIGDRSVTASRHGAGATAVVLGHGAGGTRLTPQLSRAAEALADSGRLALLYNFPYADRKRRAPDPPALLERCSRAVAEWAAGQPGVKRVVLGGRSMGGRIASQAVAAGAPAAGLLFFAYPLHAPGRTGSLRDRHLGNIAVPMLFLQGTRDAFARADLLEKTLERLGERATLHWIREADHSFKVTKRSGRDPADVEGELLATALAWLDGLGL